MTLIIETRNDMGRITRLLSKHPEWNYRTVRGDHGAIVILVEP